MDEEDLRGLMGRMRRRESGLLALPFSVASEGGRRPELEYVHAQISWLELGYPEAGVEEVIDAVRRYPKAFWISNAGVISVGLTIHGRDDVQTDMVAIFSNSPTGQRVEEFVAGLPNDERGRRPLFTPKPLAALVKLALVHAPDGYGGGPGADEHFLVTYLKVCDLVEAATVWHPDREPVRNVLQVMVQEGEHGEAGGFGEQIARLDLLLRRIPEDMGLEPDPASVFERATGVALGRFTALAAALPAYFTAMDTNDPESIARHIHFDPRVLDRLTHATEPEIGVLFKGLTLTDEDVAAFGEEDPSSPRFYTDLSRLKLRPLWRRVGPSGPLYVPFSVPFLMWRITDGIYWDIVNAAGRTDGVEAKRLFMTNFGSYLEAYIQRLVDRAMPGSALLAPRYYTGLRTGGNSSSNDPEIDLLFPYAEGAVVVEVKSARYHYVNSVAEGDLDYIEDRDLEKMLYGPASQLEKAIGLLREGAYSALGDDYAEKPVYPVLVTYGALPTLGPVWTYLLGQLRNRGILCGRNVRPLTALQVSEFEVLAALVARGHTVLDVIRGYVEGEEATLSFRNYAQRRYGAEAEIGELLRPEFEASLAHMKSIFKDSEEDPAEL